MSVALVTGAAGLIGAEAARHFSRKGLTVVGIDNDMRSYFFGREASTQWSRDKLKRDVRNYVHYDADIRNFDQLGGIFAQYGRDISLLLHAAAQPSHDWAAREPITDFSVNATGTLHLLELTRKYCPDAVFIFTSTNKVYGDTPNGLPLVELDTRWEVARDHPFFSRGIDETMSIDASLHSLFGASKTAADLLVQEYGRYFGIKTTCFRGGCLTGPGHSGAELHGFLAYLMKCAMSGRKYTAYGYKGKQVRDNIHSADLVEAFWHVHTNPRVAEVYNIGGGRDVNCSMIEAIQMCEEIAKRPLEWSYSENNRVGDHIWWISDISKFRGHYPKWQLTRNIRQILEEIHEELLTRA